MTPQPRAVGASDLFVVLDKAYRRRARRCGKCGFTIPFAVFRSEEGEEGAWAVDPSDECTPECRGELEELVARFQKKYRLAGSDRPRLL
jgi:hypothetical protein